MRDTEYEDQRGFTVYLTNALLTGSLESVLYFFPYRTHTANGQQSEQCPALLGSAYALVGITNNICASHA